MGSRQLMRKCGACDRPSARRPCTHGLVVGLAVVLAGCSTDAPPSAVASDSPPAAAPPASPAPLAPRRLAYVTGCENGELMLEQVNVFSAPQGGRVVGRLGATSPQDRCAGAVVKLVDSAQVSGRRMYRVEPLIGETRGWLSELMIGRAFDRARCKSEFDGYAEAIGRCEAP